MNFNERISFTADFQDILIPSDNQFIDDIAVLQRETDEAIACEQDKNRLLRIGVIGQIKRGKSSFINALLFKGEDVLPKAATPMTAALTRIRYAPEISAEIEYYSQEDWDQVITTANRYDPQAIKNPNEVEACRQIIVQVKETGIEPSRCVGKPMERIGGISDMKDLVGKLQDYVGAHGTYTPFVKASYLYLNLPELEGMEIVDTPGLNDPLASRSAKTREFLAQCHVVFLLSLSAQFFDKTDLQLLAQNMPDKGIGKYLLIGSAFDSVINGVDGVYPSIGEAIKREIEKLGRKAQEDYTKYLKPGSVDQRIIEEIGKAFPPKFVSSLAYQIAMHWDNLNKDERIVLNQFNNWFPPYTFTQESLFQLASFSGIQKKLDECKADKEIILANALKDKEAGAEREFVRILITLRENVEGRYKNLSEKDLAALSAGQKRLIESIERSKTRICDLFEHQSIEVEKKFSAIILELRDLAHSAARVDMKTGTETESYTAEKSGFWAGCARFFGIGGYEQRSRSVSYTYADANEAIKRLEDFVREAEQQLGKESLKAIDQVSFKKELLGVLKGLVDTSADNFDPQDILSPVNNAVSRINIPSLNLDVHKHIDTVRNRFNSSQVRGGEVQTLATEQRRIAQLILSEIVKEVDAKTKVISVQLSNTAESFIPNLTKSYQEQLSQMEKDLADKKNALKRYGELLEKFDIIKE